MGETEVFFHIFHRKQTREKNAHNVGKNRIFSNTTRMARPAPRSLSRTEKTYRRTTNDALLLGPISIIIDSTDSAVQCSIRFGFTCRKLASRPLGLFDTSVCSDLFVPSMPSTCEKKKHEQKLKNIPVYLYRQYH